MASEAQIAANRRNAQKSTGPKSEAGKAKAAQNALRHGLTAKKLVIFDESEDDFAAFHDEMRGTLAPRGPIEEHLAERVILCAWRLRRVSRVEAALMTAGAERRLWRPSDRVSDVALDAAFAERGGLTALTRYEMALERAFYRALHELERWQTRRPRAAEKDETKPIPPQAREGEVPHRDADAAIESSLSHPSLAAGNEEESHEPVGVAGNGETKPIVVAAVAAAKPRVSVVATAGGTLEFGETRPMPPPVGMLFRR